MFLLPWLVILCLPGRPQQAQSISGRDLARAQAAKDAASLEKHTNIALLVGIGDYDRDLTGLPSLKYPVPDIIAIGGLLKREGYAVSLLQDGQATAAAIRNRFKDLSTQVDKGEGTFLFYFSGHGFRAGTENRLATFGMTLSDLENQGLSLSEVQRLLLQTGAKRRMAFIDACRNDPDAKAVAARRSFSELQESEGLRILYSTAPGQVSYEDDTLGHGVFSYFIIEGLKGKAANAKDGLITFDDLRAYVTSQMKSYGITTGRIQRPYQLGESLGDFLLANAPTGEVAAPAPPNEILPTVAGTSSAAANRGTVPGRAKMPLKLVRSFGTGTIRTAAVSPDGRLAASSGGDGSVQLWSIEGGKQIASLTGLGKPAMIIQFSPDSRLLAAGGDKALWLWEIETKNGHKLDERMGTVLSLSFSADRSFLIAAGTDKTVRVWNLETGKPEATLKLQHSAGWTAFAPDSEIAGIVESDQKHSVARLWKWRSDSTAVMLPNSAGAYCLAFSPEGRKLVGGLQNGMIRSWDYSDVGHPQQLREFEGHTEVVESLVFTPDARLLASAGADKTLRWWDLASARQLRSLDVPPRTEKIMGLSRVIDGRFLAATLRAAEMEILQVPLP